jgi:hypothetical protein
MATEAQILANQKNSLKSTGPKSIDGKRISRANSLKHGLCAAVVVIESLELIQRRAWECFDGLKPQDDYQAWIVNQVAWLTLKVDRSGRMERRARDRVALRACLTWDEDRALEAKHLAGKLATSPEEVVEGLRRTPHGCDWLIDRWTRLADAARDSGGAWTDLQVRLALDLTGTPKAFREGRRPWAPPSPTPGEEATASAEEMVAFALGQVEELKQRREVVAELEEVDRALAEADLADGADAEVRRIRRYEASLHRQIKWFIAQLHNPTPNKIRPAHIHPNWVAQPEPPTEDEIAAEGWTPDQISPPFDLEPEEFPEPGQVADIPKILRSRKEKRAAKAESRRESRRRKLDRLRA